MSDITKKIFSIDAEPIDPKAIKPVAIPPVQDSAKSSIITRVDAPDQKVSRRSAKAEPVNPSVFRPAHAATPTTSNRLFGIGITFAVFTFIAMALLAWLFVRTAGVATIGTLGFAVLAAAIVIPTLSVLLLVFALRALQNLRDAAARMSQVADRLSRAETTVPDDVKTMAQAIRAELDGVETRLSKSRTQVDGFAATLTEQGREMDGTTKVMAERSETVSRALSLHRQAFESLASTFDTQMEALSAGVAAQRGKLEDLTKTAEADLAKAKQTLDAAATQVTETAESVSGTSVAADTTLRDAEGRLTEMADRITRSTAELDAVYERRAEHLSGLADRLSGERDTTESALFAQTERLGAVDAQLEITETRLTALVDHAEAIQTNLDARLELINGTLETADQRSRDFTESVADRVTDSVASARRDLSLMEAELRALQARIDNTETAALDFEETQASRARDARESRRIHLQPLDTDFPPVEPQHPLPRAKAPEPVELPFEASDEPQPLDLVEPLEIPDPVVIETPARDVVRRPAEVAAPKGKRFGKVPAGETKSGWRWRDMLGGIDATENNAAAIERPPAGVPLSAPALRPAPPAPVLPDGSDVVARLCEVQLAPSAVVDEGTIMDAGRVRLTGGESAQVDVVLARLRDPVVHLRGVLSADLEFKLRAEAFCRNYAAQLAPIADEAQIRATLGDASGRAYLLCSAALRT